MCGFGVATIVYFAIFIVVVLVCIALLRAVLPSLGVGVIGGPYWNIIQIVIWGVIAICVLLFILRLAECAGLVGGRLGMTALTFLT